ncbi:MAG: L,D-transpeptidase [Verrucomicrobiota bacterium JB023]|nr:L,D-transpeptidase [Verrucomicrobiota bacterium JB023]
MKTLHVSIEKQLVELREDSQVLLTLPVSTSKFGLGTEEGSNRTPLGTFRICEKYGCRAPSGTVFRGRVPIGQWSPGKKLGEDLVLTRIFRLEGCEPKNANTYQRYIYFHGTDQEHLIGSPASHGCIRLRNDDMITLFDLTPVGVRVDINLT